MVQPYNLYNKGVDTVLAATACVCTASTVQQ